MKNRITSFALVLVAFALIVGACIAPIQPGGESKPTEVNPLLGNLGNYSHPITVNDPRAQQYFDEGLMLTYGFNHELAIRSFTDAAKLDPSCAMCYWGIAYAARPQY